MYQNRLEQTEPAVGVLGSVNEDNLGEPGVQATRNQYLIQMLEDLGPAENRGTGIGTMVRATREAQMSPPEFEDHRTYFRVILSNDTMLDDATVEWLNQFQSLDLNENQRLALAYTLHQQEITNGIYCRLTGADSRLATTELQGLVRRGLLQQLGTRRWTASRFCGGGENTRGRTAQHRSTPCRHYGAQERILSVDCRAWHRRRAGPSWRRWGIPPATVQLRPPQASGSGAHRRTAQGAKILGTSTGSSHPNSRLGIKPFFDKSLRACQKDLLGPSV